MRSAERVFVLCSLLLVYAISFLPSEFFSALWLDSAVTPGGPARSRTSSEAPSDASPAFSTNYASALLGASVVSVEPSSCHGGSALLSNSADTYVLCPCTAPRKQFVVQLTRDVEVRTVVLRNAEHLSSGVRNFTLLGSGRYPTSTWEVLGSFEAMQRRGQQHFSVTPHSPVRYVKLQWVTSHGTEPWCTITSFQVYGIGVMETLTDFNNEEEDAAYEADALQPAVTSTPAAPLETAPELTQHTAAAVSQLDELAASLMNVSTSADALEIPTAAVTEDSDGSFPTPSALCSFPGPLLPNASIQCCPEDHANLWLPFMGMMCAMNPHDVSAAMDPRHDADGLSAPSGSTAPTATRPAGSKTVSSSTRPPYPSAADSVFGQLLRQQKSQTQELAALVLRERDLAQELNRTRALLSSFYTRYRETEKDADKHRDRLREMEVEVQQLQQQMLLREQSAEKQSERTHRDTTLAAAALVLAALALVVALVSAVSTSQQQQQQLLSASSSRWGSQLELDGSGVGVGSGPGSPPPHEGTTAAT